MTRQTVIFFGLLLFGIIGVISTYTLLSITADEEFHVWCGMEWWESWTYTREGLHPPLARIMAAALPYLFHAYTNTANIAPAHFYIYRLVLMRLGILPFYILSCLLVFIWSRKLYGQGAALWSLALYVTLSTVTAHAGLATTDMGEATMLLCAIVTSVSWMEKPTWEKAALMGVVIGLMVGTKFSTLVQFPVAMLFIVQAQAISNYRRSMPVSPIRLAHVKTGVLCTLPWAFIAFGFLYGFSFTSIKSGLTMLHDLNKNGFAIWLFKPLYDQAVWYFFPALFLFKTPLPFHASWILGNTRVAREVRRGAPVERLFPLLAALGVMLISMTSNINLGLRHVLAVYPLIAVSAGYGLQYLWQSNGWKRFAAAGLLLWQLLSFINAYPEHIAYFNELTSFQAEPIAIDSDFDWGQDMIYLSETVTQLHIDKLAVCIRNDFEYLPGFKDLVTIPVLPCPEHYTEGWIAVGISDRMLNPDKFTWLRGNHPVQIVGKTLELYHLPAK